MLWLVAISSFLLGLGLLVWSADRFVSSAVSLAQRFKIPVLIIGIVFIGFGTSVPEIIVAAIAAWHDTPALAIGNAVGSNIANVGLVLGIAALILPIPINNTVSWRELLLTWVVAFIVAMLLWNGVLGRGDGVVMLSVLVAYLLLTIFVLSKSKDASLGVTKESPLDSVSKSTSVSRDLLWWVISLFAIFLASEMLVGGAVAIARQLGVSETVIGLSIVAVGTSLPELAAAVASSIKSESMLVVGNIMGSSIFNLLAVLAMPALISPAKLPVNFMRQDYLVMVIFMVAPAVLMALFSRRKTINRGIGAVLVVGYLLYIVHIYIS